MIKPPTSTAAVINIGEVLPSFCPQHCLYFNPLPHVQGLFLFVFIMTSFSCNDVEQN
jgi:hypothetical protein